MPTSQAAVLLDKNKKEIVERWERRAKEEIDALKNEDILVVRDHLLFYLEDLIDALTASSQGTERTASDQAITRESSEQHGRLRAAVKGYDIGQLIDEYAILRQVVTDYFREHRLLDLELLEVLSRINEQALLSGAKEFSTSMTRTREKIASTLVHEIRNPLTVVSACLQIIQKQGQDPSRHRELAEKAGVEVRRIYKMTEEILDAVRLDAGYLLELDFQEVELKKSLRSSFDSMLMTYPDRLALELPGQEIAGTFAVEGLVRLLENLVVNAVKYGDPDRKITLQMKSLDQDLVIAVHNWGDPIPDDKKEAIFLSFQRSSSAKQYSTQGWGLGLTFARAVAEAHQGKIELISTRNEGTVFRVSIPKDHPSRHKHSAA